MEACPGRVLLPTDLVTGCATARLRAVQACARADAARHVHAGHALSGSALCPRPVRGVAYVCGPSMACCSCAPLFFRGGVVGTHVCCILSLPMGGRALSSPYMT